MDGPKEQLFYRYAFKYHSKSPKIRYSFLMPENSYFANNIFQNTSPSIYRPATLEQT